MSEQSRSCRVVRNDPGIRITKSNYRKKALCYLLNDFENRCAYSMEYVAEQAEIDHFDPNKKKDRVQDYSNLFPASRHCNGKKGSTWPTAEMQSMGIRFLDCTKEHDYGECLFEDPETHELVGITPAAKWHILRLDLNAPFLVRKRRQRSHLRDSLSRCPVKMRGQFKASAFLKQMKICHELLDEMIPEIPPPPNLIFG